MTKTIFNFSYYMQYNWVIQKDGNIEIDQQLVLIYLRPKYFPDKYTAQEIFCFSGENIFDVYIFGYCLQI